MVENIEIGWLAGVIDGEGSISIVRDTVEGRLHPTVMITNVNIQLLERSKQIMLRMGVGNPRIHPHDNRPGKRPTSRLYVGTVVGIQTLLRAVLPQLTAKSDQAKLMLEFLADRMGTSARKQYTARDFEIALIMSDLNHGRVDSVETARARRTKADGHFTDRRKSKEVINRLYRKGQPASRDMIQSELHGDMQSAAEMTAPAKIH